MAADISPQEYDDWPGRRAVDIDDRYLGVLEEVYVDLDGGAPRWAVLDTGVGAQPRSFVPLAGAVRDGDDIRVGVHRDRVLAAAEQMEPAGELSTEEEQRLERLYGLVDSAEMIRSEEDLRVEVVTRPAGRVRLRKVVVTEDVTLTVTVRREEVRLEPVPSEGEPAESAPAELDEGSGALFEVTLFEEVPVVTTQVVPRERVRLRKVVVTEEREVAEPVRAERIEVVEG
jgi:stress response protein YsnF